jgi:hypothetical protein
MMDRAFHEDFRQPIEDVPIVFRFKRVDMLVRFDHGLLDDIGGTDFPLNFAANLFVRQGEQQRPHLVETK